ncbi:MAG: hypothetical protein KIT84_43310 [Labilithrix sp.]|nr:hypothetical protein [Labilithrix sp.]MCW5817907.1 hypothetical protein [Labilithrix sp.]
MRTLVVSGLLAVLTLVLATSATATEVACRTKDLTQGTTQLVLEWQGGSAKGTLQRTAPSGNVTTLTVRAERHDGTIIADDIYEKDLVSHAAVVRVVDGKRYMRTDASAPWLACE